MAKDFKLNILPSLNPYDFNHAGATDENGVPFFLAKKTPKKLKANDGTVFTPSYAQPSVFEEIAKVKQTTRKKGIEKMSDIKTPSAEELNKVLMTKGSGNPEPTEVTMPTDVEPNPMDQLKNDYLTFMQSRMARQKELDSDYDQLKSQERPSGFATLDLTPAFAFVDQMTGSKLTPSYKAPTAAKEFDAKLKAAQELALMNGDKLSGDQFAAMGFDEKNRQYDDNQNQENARLDKTLANQMAIAKIAAAGRAERDKNDDLQWQRFRYQIARDNMQDQIALGKQMGPLPNVMKQQVAEFSALIPPTGDIPGFGPFDSLKPLIGLDSQGQMTRQKAMSLASNLKYLRTGATATDVEQKAILTEFGIAPGAPDEMIRNGIKNLIGEINTRMGSVSAGYRPEVVQSYNKNMQSKKVTVSNGQETLEIDRSDLKDAMADGYQEVK